MASLFAIGVGGSGAKCIEALTHLHAAGLLKDSSGLPYNLNTFLVEPDEQSTLLTRAEIAIERYQKMQEALAKQAFAAGSLRHFGTWNPLESAHGALSLDRVFPKNMMRTQAEELCDLFNCLYPLDEQSTDLTVGFRGRPPIGSAVMSRIEIADVEQSTKWHAMLDAISSEAGNAGKPIIHMFGSVFGGTGASGVPTLGQMLKTWIKDQGFERIPIHASLLLPYFDFEGLATRETGVHAEAKAFQLNTDAALQYLTKLSDSEDPCFQRVYLVGSDLKARYKFSIGGTSQRNDAHVIELLATLGAYHGISSPDNDQRACAYTLSRAHETVISWEDLPDWKVVGKELARAARFAVAWLNNFSLELDEAQTMSMPRFLGGAPWASQFFQSKDGPSTGQGGKPSIRDSREIGAKNHVDSYVEVLLQWLRQFSENTGTNFQQDLYDGNMLKRSQHHEDDLSKVVKGAARPTRTASNDTTEAIKVHIDRLPSADIRQKGVAGLVDTLWSLSI